MAPLTDSVDSIFFPVEGRSDKRYIALAVSFLPLSSAPSKRRNFLPSENGEAADLAREVTYPRAQSPRPSRAAVAVDRKSDARPKEASQVFQSRIMSGHGLYRRLANRGRDKIAPAPGIYARHKFALYMSVHGKCDDRIATPVTAIRP